MEKMSFEGLSSESCKKTPTCMESDVSVSCLQKPTAGILMSLEVQATHLRCSLRVILISVACIVTSLGRLQ
jgi:hypothetical protein